MAFEPNIFVVHHLPAPSKFGNWELHRRTSVVALFLCQGSLGVVRYLAARHAGAPLYALPLGDAEDMKDGDPGDGSEASEPVQAASDRYSYGSRDVSADADSSHPEAAGVRSDSAIPSADDGLGCNVGGVCPAGPAMGTPVLGAQCTPVMTPRAGAPWSPSYAPTSPVQVAHAQGSSFMQSMFGIISHVVVALPSASPRMPRSLCPEPGTPGSVAPSSGEFEPTSPAVGPEGGCTDEI